MKENKTSQGAVMFKDILSCIKLFEIRRYEHNATDYVLKVRFDLTNPGGMRFFSFLLRSRDKLRDLASRGKSGSDDSEPSPAP